MVYTTETEVYDRTGFSSTIIQTLSSKSSAEVTTLINGFISDAETDIQRDIGYPIVIREERHYGDGNKNQFELGPEDDPFAEEGDYDPEGGLVEIYNVWFAAKKMKKPWPENCDWPENNSADWDQSNATLTDDLTTTVARLYSLKAVFSAAGYVEYPSAQNLDKIIDTWDDFFVWLQIDDVAVTITLRLYDKDGNYEEQDITLRQDDVGQYVWIDINEMTDAIDWDDTRLQYFRIYVDGACTLYVDNACFADSWAFTAPEGLFHVSVADNISSEAEPSEGYPFFVTYGYDPFYASVPGNIAEAAEWLVGISIIDYLRGIRYVATSFEVWGETLELDTDQSREGLLGVRTKMEKRYWRCLGDWGGGSYGVV